MSPERKFRPRTRATKLRDSRLIVVATEGVTERRYLQTLISPEFFQKSRIHVEVLDERDPTKSSPEHVITDLDKFKREYRLDSDDQLWMMIDHDRWGDAKLDHIARLANQKGYNLAVSSPCFELWILLHLESWERFGNEQKLALLDQGKQRGRTNLESRILESLGSYNKSNPKCERFVENVHVACARARQLDIAPETRWPQGLCTRVYRLAEEILK